MFRRALQWSVGSSVVAVSAAAAVSFGCEVASKNSPTDFSPDHPKHLIPQASTKTQRRKKTDRDMPDLHDYIVCGSGPGASAWVRTTLKAKPDARILVLERGPYCKTDILTERQPFRLAIDTNRMVAHYEHGVMQGSTLGGSSVINNYAWVTPSYLDLRKALGVQRDAATEALVEDYENMIEGLIGPREPPHPLHQLLTVS